MPRGWTARSRRRTPPGIPVFAPGEVVTSGALDALRAALAEGSRIAYAADPSLATLQVVSGP
jgi:lysine decarboxylase